MSPLPVEGADLDFYVRQFATLWYRGPQQLVTDIEQFTRIYRVPDAMRTRVRIKIWVTFGPIEAGRPGRPVPKN